MKHGFHRRHCRFHQNDSDQAKSLSVRQFRYDWVVAHVRNRMSPVVVVISGSMEPGFQRGDILLLHMSKAPIRTGEIVVFNINGRDIPIVHHVVQVHERRNTGEADILTKGDNNKMDDRGLYAYGQRWLQRKHIVGRPVGFLPYVGWVAIIMPEKPILKYILIGALGLLVITSKD